ncbi:MAG: hypothetical protein ACTHLH_00730, partial [Solirubrobacterales bacterium]
AAERRLPTISAADLAGQATLYVFDYRRDGRPLRGRAPLRAFREGREMEAAGMTGPRPIPTDFLALVRRRLASGAPWPQVAYTAAATGALTAAVALELLRGRRVPPLVRVDLHRATRTPAGRAAESARRPLELLRTAGAAARLSERPAPRCLAAPRWALAPLQALQAAPSTHNEQPWAISPAAERLLRLGPRPDLHRRGDDGRAAISLGCALGAIEAVVPATVVATSGLAAEIAIEGDPDPTVLALVRARQTNRSPYSGAAVSTNLLARLVAAAEGSGALTAVVDGPLLGRCAEAVEFAKRGELGDAVAMEELLAWYRRSPRDRRYDSDGLLPATLGGGRAERLSWGVAGRGGAITAALGRSLLVRRTGSLIKSSSAVLLLAPGRRGEPGLVALGRALMALWLEAASRGLAAHPISVDGGKASALTDLLGEQDEPVSLAVRIGYAAAAPRSPRLPLERLFVQAETAS